MRGNEIEGHGHLFAIEPAGRGAYAPREPVPSRADRPLSPVAVFLLRYVQDCGDEGATLAEACVALRLGVKTLQVARQELRRAGRLVDSGRTRPNLDGIEAAVYVATEGP